MLTTMCFALQAVEADRKDDRDIVCEEVFTDLTGGLDDFLKGQATAGVTAVWHIQVWCITMSLSFISCALRSTFWLAEQLQVPREQNCRFYEVLAPYFRKVCTPTSTRRQHLASALIDQSQECYATPAHVSNSPSQ